MGLYTPNYKSNVIS